ncbi:protein FAR1-RELATED SEQUENCE 11-like [Rutidosis leptorrhynchoides]|uniref:protein FAR1-RELATED SEQUENCE 11-like n=1 Tax=Rutidosis leptorrhynchoides TaxID=125765 RepID=UPI003A995A1B
MYQKYGDVVVFDTTFKVNSYDMPFGIFVGVDNHEITVLFGCALLRNETTTTFQWLFKNFCLLMRRPPLKILTDQDQWMTQTIAKEIPSAKHAFCKWHITTKFSSWFMSVLRSEYSSLYKIKSFWVPAYLRDFFFGGMTTTGRSESINAFIKKFISSRTCLSDFIRQVNLAVEDVQQKQLHDTMFQKYRGSYLRSLSPLEEQGHQFLTPFAFKKFQEQFGLAMQYLVKETAYSNRDENIVNFIVKHQKATRYHNVVWDGNVAKYTCKNFEFVGILCLHILSVFIHKGCFEVPSKYWHPRWSRNDTQVVEIPQEPIRGTSNSDANNEVEADVIDVVQCPIKSKTKGRPSEKRMKSVKELPKQRRCGRCRFGHNINTCKERISDEISNQKKTIDLDGEDINPVLSKKLLLGALPVHCMKKVTVRVLVSCNLDRWDVEVIGRVIEVF